MVVLLEFPKPLRPSVHRVTSGNQRPILVFDLGPQLDCDSGRADGAVIPSIGRPQTILFHPALTCRSQLGTTSLEGPPAITGDQALDLLDQQEASPRHRRPAPYRLLDSG